MTADMFDVNPVKRNLRLTALTLLLVLPVTVSAQQMDWPYYGSDQAGSKYVALDQINAENVSGLQVAWVWETPDNRVFAERADAEAGPWRSTPIMVNGVLYISTSLGAIAAVDAASGEQLWEFSTGSWERGPHPNWGNNHRGVAWWSDGVRQRIFMGDNDGVLWSLDASTGQPDREFGDNGSVDLKLGLGREVDTYNYGVISPPTIVGDTVIMGASIHGWPRVPRFLGDAPPGHVRGFDARTGEQKWIFHTIPQGNEFGTETWENESWRLAGGVNVWASISADTETGYIYLPVSTPSNDWYGGQRLGDNLFAESLVCLDAETGELIWYFQTVKHGLWDYDLPAAPNLLDITVDGRDIKAVAQITKQGFVFVFDRLTGEPVWPIEDRPVPQSNEPGERTSPTQPFPTRPLPFEPQGISAQTLIDFTPELRAEAMDIIAPYDYGPIYTPPSQRGLIQFPGYSGGANWTGAAVDPETGIMYVPSFSLPRFIRLIAPDPTQSNYHFVRDTSFNLTGPRGLPLIKPPYARITAINLNTGEHEWMVPHGEGIRQRLIGMGIEDPGPVGSPGRHGPLLTAALLFIAQLDETRPVMRSLDKATGAIVSEHDLPLPPGGTPMSYMLDGRQYIVVAIGAGPDTRLMAFSLP